MPFRSLAGEQVAIVTRDKEELQSILPRVQQLSDHLGLKINRAKTEVYLRDHSAPMDLIPVKPPIFKYPGHVLVHPEWVKWAQENIMDEARTQLAGY